MELGTVVVCPWSINNNSRDGGRAIVMKNRGQSWARLQHNQGALPMLSRGRGQSNLDKALGMELGATTSLAWSYP